MEFKIRNRETRRMKVTLFLGRLCLHRSQSRTALLGARNGICGSIYLSPSTCPRTHINDGTIMSIEGDNLSDLAWDLVITGPLRYGFQLMYPRWTNHLFEGFLVVTIHGRNSSKEEEIWQTDLQEIQARTERYFQDLLDPDSSAEVNCCR